MEYYSLYGFSFEPESLLLSAPDELKFSQPEYEQWQRSFEFDIGAFVPLQPPNDVYEAHQMTAAQCSSLQDDHTQDFHYQHAGRINDAHEDFHQSQFIGWDSHSGTRHEPRHPSDLPDESMGQILYSDSSHYRLDPGLNIFGHTISPASEVWAPPTTITNTSKDRNYSFRAVVESEEEYPYDEDVIFDVASEEESTVDERGFEGDDEGSDDNGNGDDEDSDTLMDLDEGEYEDESGVEIDEDNGEAIYMPEEDSFRRISRHSIFNRHTPVIIYEEEIWEIGWPSGAWRNAFNRTEQN